MVNTLPCPIVLRTLDIAAEKARQLPRDAETKPGAASLARHPLIDLPERVEHAFQMLARYPRPRIRDFELHAITGYAARRDVQCRSS